MREPLKTKPPEFKAGAFDHFRRAIHTIAKAKPKPKLRPTENSKATSSK